MAPRLHNKLTALGVKALKEPGWYGDGGGLWVRIDKHGGRRWVFVFFWRGRRSEMGLGSVRDVDLREARKAREDARRLVRHGENPIEQRRRARTTTGGVTFGEWATEIAPVLGPRAEKARKAWVMTMTEKVGHLANITPARVTTDDVLRALKPYWVTRPETGRRMRQRIERVLDAARSKGLIPEPWQNPARLKGHLENLLEKRSTAVAHRLALPFADAAAFMSQLEMTNRPAAVALKFTILSAVRSIEARGATWGEMDLAQNVWTIPADRMKGEAGFKRVHRVALSKEAVKLLRSIRPKGAKPRDLVFPNPLWAGQMFSENALQGVLIDMGFKGKATVHGFRSTFRDWAGETTDFQRETIEAALAHAVGDQTERAYRRGDALEKRRQLMEAWATYLANPKPTRKAA